MKLGTSSPISTPKFFKVGGSNIWGTAGNWEIPQSEGSPHRVRMLWGLSHFVATGGNLASEIPKSALAVQLIMELNLERDYDYVLLENGAPVPYSLSLGEQLEFTVESYWDRDGTRLADRQVCSFRYVEPYRVEQLNIPIHIFCPIVSWDDPESTTDSQIGNPAPNICLRHKKNNPAVLIPSHGYGQFSISRVYFADGDTSWP